MREAYMAAVAEKYDMHSALQEFFPGIHRLGIESNGDGTNHYPANFAGHVSEGNSSLHVMDCGWLAHDFHTGNTYTVESFLARVVYGTRALPAIRYMLRERTGIDSWNYGLPLGRVEELAPSPGGWDGSIGVRAGTAERRPSEKISPRTLPWFSMPSLACYVDRGVATASERLASLGAPIPATRGEQYVEMISRLYRDEDIICIGEHDSSMKLPGMTMGPLAPASEHKSRLSKKGWIIPPHICNATFRTCEFRRKQNIVETKWFVVEWDHDCSVDEQADWWSTNLGGACYSERWRKYTVGLSHLVPEVILWSGNKSLHAVLDSRLFGDDPKGRSKLAKRFIDMLAADTGGGDINRYFRLAGHARECRAVQDIRYLRQPGYVHDFEACRKEVKAFCDRIDAYRAAEKETGE